MFCSRVIFGESGRRHGDVVIMQGAARSYPMQRSPDALATTWPILVTADYLNAPIRSSVCRASISAGHRYGPESTQFAAAVDLCFTALEKILHARLSGSAERTLLLLVADHGQMAVDPATTIYLNQRFPVLSNLIKTNRNGKLLAPAGSCRDLFLHIHEEHLDEVQTYLREELAGHSAVYQVSDLIAEGFFGPEPLSPTSPGPSRWSGCAVPRHAALIGLLVWGGFV